MRILQFEPEHDEYRKKLRDFFDREVRPYSEKWEKDHIVPREAWTKMGREGLLAPMVPEEYGGKGGDFRYPVVCFEEYSGTNQSGFFLTLHNDVVVPYIISYGTEEAKKKYLPGCVNGDIVTAVAMTEPGAGSDLASMESTFVEDGDEYVINGNKTFISNAHLCDVVIVAAKDPNEENPHQAVSLFIVECTTPGFERGERFDKMGMYSQDTAEMFFKDVRVPKENLLGQKGGGFIILMEKLQQERLCAVCGGVCGAELMVNEMMNFAKEIQTGGKPLSKQQAVQFALMEMYIEVKMARSFCDALVVDHIAGENVVVDTSLAKYYVTEMANKMADRGLDLLGDMAQFEEKCPLCRGWRDVRITTIFAGTSEIMKMIGARFLGL